MYQGTKRQVLWLAPPTAACPLHQAAERGDHRMARLLVRHGADVQRADSGFSGRTAMHYVMETGNRTLVNFLIQGVFLRMVPVPGPTPSVFGI